MPLVKGIASFFLMAIVAISAENAVFSRSLGISRALRLVDDERVDTFIFGGLLCAVEVVSGLLACLINRFLTPLLPTAWVAPLRPLFMTLCAIAAFFAVLFACLKCFKTPQLRQILDALAMATFNCCVLGVLYITTIQKFTLAKTLGFAVGSAVGYVLAVLVVTEGQRKLRNRNMPQAFRGLPANLIYIGILALAIYAFTGHMVLI